MPQEEASLTRVGEAVNQAMQVQLVKADALLRKILQAGDLKVRRRWWWREEEEEARC